MHFFNFGDDFFLLINYSNLRDIIIDKFISWVHVLFYLPDLDFTYCNFFIFLVSQHIFAFTINWNTRAILVCKWKTVSLAIKWLLFCTQLIKITSNKARPFVFLADYLCSSFFFREVTSARKIKKHRIFIMFSLARFSIRWPQCWGVTSDAVAIFKFKQGNSGALAITPRVEVIGFPAMNRSTIEKYSNKSLIA
jgi:hypothetical protein